MEWMRIFYRNKPLDVFAFMPHKRIKEIETHQRDQRNDKRT